MSMGPGVPASADRVAGCPGGIGAVGLASSGRVDGSHPRGVTIRTGGAPVGLAAQDVDAGGIAATRRAVQSGVLVERYVESD